MVERVGTGRTDHKAKLIEFSCFAFGCVSWGAPQYCQGRGEGIAVRERQIQLRTIAENCGKFAGKLRCRDQTSRSLKDQHFCTGGTKGTNKHAMWTSKKQLWKNCEISKDCEKLRNCEKLRT